MAIATLAFIDGLGTPEMMMIMVLVLVLFGGQKLPEFARGLGKSIREFKKAASGVEEEFKRALDEDERRHAPPPAISPPPAATGTPNPGSTDYTYPDHEYTDNEYSEHEQSPAVPADAHKDAHQESGDVDEAGPGAGTPVAPAATAPFGESQDASPDLPDQAAEPEPVAPVAAATVDDPDIPEPAATPASDDTPERRP